MAPQNRNSPTQAPTFDQVTVQAGGSPGHVVPGLGHIRNPIDQLFAQHGREAAPVFPARAIPAVAPDLSPSGSGQFLSQTQRTASGSVTDLAAEYDWLREERERLEAYTRNQFSLITKQREELAARRAEVEAAFALREQELNRQQKLVADRTENVEEREKKLAAGEAEWSLRREELAQAEQQSQQLNQARLKLQKDVDEQRLLLKNLRFQSDQLQETVRAARAQLLAFERMAAGREQSQQEEQAKFQARQEQLDLRLKKIEGAEESLRRREQELDEMEAQLRFEIEQREKQVEAGLQEIEEIRQSLRAQSQRASNRPTPPGGETTARRRTPADTDRDFSVPTKKKF